MIKALGGFWYYPKDIIGQGSFGIVFSGFYSLFEPVAIKRINADVNNKSAYEDEVELMIKAKDHPNILRYISNHFETNDDFMYRHNNIIISNRPINCALFVTMLP